MDNEYDDKRPIDFLPGDPYTAVEQSWDRIWPSFVMEEILYWSFMAMSHQSSLYTELKYRTRFIGFFIDLLPFLEATYVYARKNGSDYKLQYLTRESEEDPIKVIKQFCNKYPHSYVRVELWFFYQAVDFYQGPIKDSVEEYDLSKFHLHLLTVIEAFYLIMGVKE